MVSRRLRYSIHLHYRRTQAGRSDRMTDIDRIHVEGPIHTKSPDDAVLILALDLFMLNITTESERTWVEEGIRHL